MRRLSESAHTGTVKYLRAHLGGTCKNNQILRGCDSAKMPLPYFHGLVKAVASLSVNLGSISA